ncbi:MAG: type 4a pilus biogenesis protein PilO [candidate division WOR-3 bacterium]
MEILKRRVLLGGILGLVIITIIFVVVFYRPHFQNRAKISREIFNLKKEIKENEAMIKDIPRLRSQVIALEDSNRLFMSKIVPRSEILSVVRNVVNIGSRYNLTFTEIRPPGLDTIIEPDNPKLPLKSIPFVFTFQGRFYDAMRFMDALANEPYFVRTPEIEIVARNDLRPQLEIKLLVNFYVSGLVAR